jgi:hypothetical protein
MMLLRRALLFGTFLLAIFTSPVCTISAQELYVLETSDLRLIYYAKQHEFLVKHVARCFENSFAFHRELFRYTPSEKVTVLLNDFSDYGNAGAGSVPANHLSVSIAPYSYAYETTPANERMNATMNHEVVHIVAADKASARDKFFRACFSGKVRETDEHPETILYSWLTAPRRSAPRWYHEGIAVFFETWMAGGLGRALGAWDEMYFRTLVADSERIFDPVSLESEGAKVDFQIGVVSYLYGTRFMSYMALTESPEKLKDWVSRYPGSHADYGSQFKNVFGNSLDDSWKEWIAWEREFQAHNLDTIRQYPTTPYRTLSSQSLGSVSRAYYDSAKGTLIVAVNYPGQVPHIASIDMHTGKITKICDVEGAALFYVTSLSYDPTTRTVFYTSDNDEWRDLRSVDLNTGRRSTLIKDVRVGDLAMNPTDKSIWGVKHFNGISSIVRIPHPYSEWNLMYAWPYGQDVYGLDISPDGKTLSASLSEINGRQTLISMKTADLMNRDSSYATIFDFGNSIPGDFVFSPDGRYITGASYYTGVSNVFRYDRERDSMEVLSNAETGFFRPTPYTQDSTIVFRYTPKGFAPVVIENRVIEDVNPITFLGQEIVDKHPIVKSWKVGSPARINLDSLTIDSGAYHALGDLSVASLYPVVQGYKDYPAYGIHADISDPLGLYTIGVTASYSPDKRAPSDEQWHLAGSYDHMAWHFGASWNEADFYDLFGPTKSSRKGYTANIKYSKSLISDGARNLNMNVGVAGYSGLERLPAYQNVLTSFDKFASVSGSIAYRNRNASLGAVDHEKGHSANISMDNKFVSGRTFFRTHAGGSIGFALPVHHSSLWFYGYGGWSPSERDEPLGNFYFGGFGNNWVDHQSIERFREYYAFPGLGLNEIGGTTFGKGMIELKLPPIRFRRFGIPALYATFAKLSIFGSALSTDFDRADLRTHLYNAGGQLDLKITLMSHLKMTFSAGYAWLFEKGSRPIKESMFSFKIL